ncbi:MAG: hypothetical protein ABIR11_08855 [Candidatus Limnocylindrales bacterium]
MRRRSVVAIAALIAAFALAGLPAPAGSTTPSIAKELAPAAFTSVTIPADSQAQQATGQPDAALRSAGHLAAGTSFVEPGVAPTGPVSRPRVDQPPAPAGADWKAPRYTLSGYATFYANGTTAMRLPRGTVVRICGGGGCIERTVNDYGPQKKTRVVDLYTPDFFQVCGCPWYSGTTWVTVSIY